MKNTSKTLADVILKLTVTAPDKLVALKRGDDSPFWIGRAKFVFNAVTVQAWRGTIISVEHGAKLTSIVLQ